MTVLAMGVGVLDDRTAVLAAQRGDAAALERILSELARELLPLALALAGPSGEADRLVGDALSRVYERIGQLERPGSLLPWSRRILVRAFLDERRWLRRRPQCSIESVEIATSATPAAEILDVRRAVGALPRRDRALIALHYWQGLSIADCAEELGIPEGTAKSRLSGALARVRKELGRDE
ncbi:MAG TPA: RNA polymerase sigma factor [Candidatus Limnocylindria bacterium]|nr:RNA polymerase sigma factor [Candidatus Limnocylindria bacterium]